MRCLAEDLGPSGPAGQDIWATTLEPGRWLLRRVNIQGARQPDIRRITLPNICGSPDSNVGAALRTAVVSRGGVTCDREDEAHGHQERVAWVAAVEEKGEAAPDRECDAGHPDGRGDEPRPRARRYGEPGEHQRNAPG